MKQTSVSGRGAGERSSTLNQTRPPASNTATFTLSLGAPSDSKHIEIHCGEFSGMVTLLEYWKTQLATIKTTY
jgi:hypothetical protein